MKYKFNQLLIPIVAVIGLSLSGQSNAEIILSGQNSTIQKAQSTQIDPEIQAQNQTIAALQVLSKIDQGQSGEIWDDLSLVIKPLVNRNGFIERIEAARSNLGAVLTRQNIAAYRLDEDGKNATPKGIYYIVVFSVTFSKGQSGRELLSFRLDEDQVWRVAGYFVKL